MKKIKEIIVGLILGFVLVFFLALEPQKVSASDLSDLSDLTNIEINWNTTLDWSILISYESQKGYKNGIFTLHNCSFNSYASEYTSLQILTKTSGDGNNQLKYNNTSVYSNGNWSAQAYQLNNWATPPTKVTFEVYDNNNELISDIISPGDMLYTVLVDFFNSNTTTGNSTGNYTLTYDGNGATSGTIPDVKNVVAGSTVDLKNYNPGNLEKDGYVFLGWNTNASATTPLTDITITSNTTVYAVWERLFYYTITFNRNGATSGDLPPLQDVLSGTTFDLNNYNPGNLSKTDGTFIGWNTDASATTPLSSIVVNSDVLLYAIFSENPKSVNIKITCRDNVVWQGNATFSNNKIVGGVSWDSPTMTNVFFVLLDCLAITLITEKYGLTPNYTSNQLLLFFRPFSTEKDDNGNYLAYINLIRLTTPKGTYAINYTSDTSPKNINFDSWLASEGLTNMLKIDSDNYYFNLEVSWSLEEPLPQGVAEWGNVATIMSRIMASVTTLLNINIGFITIGNLLLIIISLSILFFVIKVWKGGN